MKVKYVGDAPAMSYILGVVQPGEIYEIDNVNGKKLLTGLFELVDNKELIKKEVIKLAVEEDCNDCPKK